MFKPFALVAFFAAVTSAGTLPEKIFNRPLIASRSSGRIINGEETTIEKNPHQVSIRYENIHGCGGSIISKYWVLTAAHCFGGDLHSYTVLAGTADKFNEKSTGSVHKVDRIINHPDFGSNGQGAVVNDIALIHVLEPFEFDETCQSIELFNKDEEALVGSIGILTGWGSAGSYFPQILNLAEIPIISKKDCYKQYDYLGGIGDGQICAAYDDAHKDACQQDSGGPLSIDGRLAGVVSWGDGCAVPGHPGVYTEVAYFRDWIQNFTNI